MALGRHDNPERNDRTASAPYNFVPLPAQPLAMAADELPAQDRYTGLTGWIDCALETLSPLYVRGMLTEDQYRAQGHVSPDKLTVDQKAERAPFFSTGQDTIEGWPRPIIPGSSLRGMLRTLVEIVGFGAMRWVGAEPAFTYRAVAAANDDPLKAPYLAVIGSLARNVRAGYLVSDGESWWIQPALTPREKGWRETAAYLKVKEHLISSQALPGFLRLDSPDYRPQLHEVGFNVAPRVGQRGPYTAVTEIGTPRGYAERGWLVCTGNMRETERETRRGAGGNDSRRERSRRKNHVIVLGRNESAQRLRIPEETVRAYRLGLTPFQKEQLTDWGSNGHGCLASGNPVFYVERPERRGEVLFFGHCPNFRIPAWLAEGEQRRAATPLDFLPLEHRAMREPDLADAIFGWVEARRGGDEQRSSGGPAGQRAGRVFVGDARLAEGEEKIWYHPIPIAPRVLAGPKPTTFQHYLIQNRQHGHDPDNKVTLAHYGTPPDETSIRGYKLYWTKGNQPSIEATSQERQHESQVTRIVPLKPGVRFSFRLRFENLRPEEVGALLWVLTLPDGEEQPTCHRLGMGKPLGMGAVRITPTLCLWDRRSRYERLFDGEGWFAGDPLATSADDLVRAFEAWMFDRIAAEDRGQARRFAEIPRIQMLLTLLRWRTGDRAWLEQTRYLAIERESGVQDTRKVNEYLNRPVLPDPLAVVEPATRRSPTSSVASPTSPPVRGATTQPTRSTPPHSPRTEQRPAEPPARPSADAADEDLFHGEVISFGLGASRSLGYIRQDDLGTQILVHRNHLVGMSTLTPGQRVVFEVVLGVKSLEARRVRPE